MPEHLCDQQPLHMNSFVLQTCGMQRQYNCCTPADPSSQERVHVSVFKPTSRRIHGSLEPTFRVTRAIGRHAHPVSSIGMRFTSATVPSHPTIYSSVPSSANVSVSSLASLLAPAQTAWVFRSIRRLDSVLQKKNWAKKKQTQLIGLLATRIQIAIGLDTSCCLNWWL